MSIFDWFRRTPNPTTEWQGDPRRPLSVDLDKHTICGVPLGGRFADLSFLGPAHVDRHLRGTFNFRSVGLQVDTTTIEGLEIDSFAVVVIPDGYFPEYDRYRGPIVYRGAPLRKMGLRTEAQVVNLFGDPLRIDRDEEETVLFYEFGSVGREIELTPDQRIKTFRVYRM